MNKNFDNGVFYHIYTLGFCGAPNDNDFIKTEERLIKIYDIIPHLNNMGINSVFLGPLFESETHGYDTADYLKVDGRLGTNKTLKELINELHKNGIKVIIDAVFNHCSRSFFAFKDLKENKEKSKYRDWFQNIIFNKNNHYKDGFTYEGWSGHLNLVKFNHNNNGVKDYLFNAVKMWINEFDIDGLRLDAADCISFDFLAELSFYCRSLKKDIWIKGEVIHGDYTKWIKTGGLDSVTNYECYKGLWSSFNDKNFFEINYTLNRQFGDKGIYKDYMLYNFIDNHDVDRISEKLKNEFHIYPLYGLLFTIPGIPSIYYGSEFFIKGKKGKHSDEDLRPAINIKDLYINSKYKNLVNDIKKLIEIRKNNIALVKGDYKNIYVSGQQLVFSRNYQDQTIIIALNSLDKPKTIEINSIAKQNYHDILNNETVDFAKLTIPANWLRILI